MGILKKIKKKFIKYNVKGNNNRVYIVRNGIKEEEKRTIKGLEIFIDGNDNEIVIEGNIKFQSSIIVIRNSGCKIYIENTPYEINNMYVEMVQPCKNQSVHFCKNLSINGASFYIYGNDASLEIGEDCMFSTDIIVMTGDGHKLIDKNSGEILNNKQNTVKISKHVWVGRGAVICKGVEIPANCVIGTRALVTKSFSEENIILAGIPARIIKHDVLWDREENF